MGYIYVLLLTEGRGKKGEGREREGKGKTRGREGRGGARPPNILACDVER